MGKQPFRTAHNTAAVWFDYRLGSPELRGWSVDGGARYVGKVPATVDNSQFNPAYTVFDATIRYEHGSCTFALNASNLFNKTYIAGAGQFFEQSRTLQVKVSARW
ncbi:TonB-dependent receptor [Variovorax paradoxus]|nr:TonB-dependent receptor [Variovorax paradoxus]